MNAKQYLDTQAAYLRSQGWEVTDHEQDYSAGKIVQITANLAHGDFLVLTIGYSDRTHRWTFGKLTRVDYRGRLHHSRTYRSASTVIRIYGENRSAGVTCDECGDAHATSDCDYTDCAA